MRLGNFVKNGSTMKNYLKVHELTSVHQNI